MTLVSSETAPIHSDQYPETPSVTVLFGDESSVDIGMVRAHVPAGPSAFVSSVRNWPVVDKQPIGAP